MGRILPGETRPEWMNKVTTAVLDTDTYDLAISLDGLKRYGTTADEVWLNAVKEGRKLDARGLPMTCSTCWELKQVFSSIDNNYRSSDDVRFYSDELDLTGFDPFD